MKAFDKFFFDKKTYDEELKKFENLLQTKQTLDEQKEILPFFNTHSHLASRIASFFPIIDSVDRIAFEFDLWGDFRCDLVVGDSKRNAFCFIEFEDANEDSLFRKSVKFKPDFAPRLEHGCSQIIDWAYRLRHASTRDLKERFETDSIRYEMILVIGRDSFLDLSMKDRLEWRSQNVMVDSKRFSIFTFDELLDSLQRKQLFF